MTSRRRRKKPSTRRSRGPGFAVPVWLRRTLIVATILVLTAVLIGLGLDRVRRYVNSRPGFQVHLDRVRVLEKPSWLSDDDVAAIRASAALGGSRGFFDPDLPGVVRDAWGRSPRLGGAPAVSRIHPNRLAVTLLVRRPIAAVHDFGDAVYPLVLVDREGVRWPGRFAVIPERFGDLPVITGADPALGTPAAGSNRWGDDRIRHGVAVAVDLARGLPGDLAERLGIRVIGISRVGTTEPMTSEIVLEARDGIRIEWGRSSISDHAGREVSVAAKVAHLAMACRNPGLEGVRVLRVQYDTLGFVER